MAKKGKGSGGSIDFTVTASGLNKVDKDAKKAGKSFNQLDKNARSADRAGKGVANMLMNQCIDFANHNNAKEIFLISNDSLTIARNLYDKYGFKEVDLDSQKYDRGNVKMRLTLD